MSATPPNFFTPLQEDGGAITTATLNALKAILTAPTFSTVTVQNGTTAQGPVSFSSALNGITAHAGGGQANAVPLTGVLNRITITATANDSVLLPSATLGALVLVRNDGTNAAAVFPNGATDVINALAVDTAFSVAAAKSALFFCPVAGQWSTLLSA